MATENKTELIESNEVNTTEKQETNSSPIESKSTDSNKLQTDTQIDSKNELENNENNENKLAEGLSENKDSDNDSKESHITNIPNDTLLDRAYGLCIGAAIGDSIGSYCEFSNWAIDTQTLKEAMEMLGGGTWGNQVTRGQVTDDTELAISLSYGLCNIINKNENKFDVYYITQQYEKWHKSHPFDQGFCTSDVLYYAPVVESMKMKAIAYNLEKAEQYKSDGNLANGSLMRCMPLVLYGYNLKSYENLFLLMKSDAELTHANIYVYLVNTCYAIIVLYLLKCDMNEKDKHINAYNTMIKWLRSQCKHNDKDRGVAANNILNEWLKYVKDDDTLRLHPATTFKGFVKIAFQRVCYHLWHNNDYCDAIRSVVGEGGDSDTNACIVGGVIGVLNGLNGIPNEYIEKIHKCKPRRDDRDVFQAKWYFKNKMIELLLKNAPTDEEFINNRVKKYDD